MYANLSQINTYNRTLLLFTLRQHTTLDMSCIRIPTVIWSMWPGVQYRSTGLDNFSEHFILYSSLLYLPFTLRFALLRKKYPFCQCCSQDKLKNLSGEALVLLSSRVNVYNDQYRPLDTMKKKYWFCTWSIRK